MSASEKEIRQWPSLFSAPRKVPVGVYIHVPFCDGKCPYCDFYSLRGDNMAYDAYVSAAKKRLKEELSGLSRPVETVYFGGGTPSLLGGKRIASLLEVVSPYLASGAEITVEANPSRELGGLFRELYAAGVNRISMGLQSANEEELRLLGRRHTAAQAAYAVEEARKAGFQNISLDLMIALPDQNEEKLLRSIEFCASLGVEHISSYLLKIEPGTPFWERKDAMALPDEDTVCDLYLFVCRELEKRGYMQYEISNFAKQGFEGKHNLKYWRCEEYLGIGPGAHSFIDGRRMYYPRDLLGFLKGDLPIDDGEGGSPEEFCMLALRLKEGLSEEKYSRRYAKMLPDAFWEKASRLEKGGLCHILDEKEKRILFLTREGFLVSNAIIADLTDTIE